MSQIAGKSVEYSYDSARLVGHFCKDGAAADPRPGVVIVHDAFGVSDAMKQIAARVAELGYAVLAADLWGDGAQLKEESAIGPMIGRMASDRKCWMGRLHAAQEALAAQPGVNAGKIAMTGYCFGGASVLEYLRTTGGVKGVVSFHGGLDLVGGEWESAPAGGKALILTGYDDPTAKSATVVQLADNLTKAGVDWEIDMYGHTKHGFTRPESDRANKPEFVAYNAQSDRRSWAAMTRFLEEVFA